MNRLLQEPKKFDLKHNENKTTQFWTAPKGKIEDEVSGSLSANKMSN